MAKTWQEKFNSSKGPQVKVIEKRFADLPEGTRMFIATPQIIAAYLKDIPRGMEVDLKTMRRDLALEASAENSCPVTTSIFLRIVAEVALEEYKESKRVEGMIPFWRVITPKMPIAKKLSCGTTFIATQRKNENLT